MTEPLCSKFPHTAPVLPLPTLQDLKKFSEQVRLALDTANLNVVSTTSTKHSQTIIAQTYKRDSVDNEIRVTFFRDIGTTSDKPLMWK